MSENDMAQEILDRLERDNPALYEALLGRVPPAQRIVQPDADPGRETYDRQQAELRQQMEAEVSKTQGYYQRGVVRDKYRKAGLGQPYQPAQQAKSAEQLASDYKREIAGVRPGSEAARIVRGKYRKLGLDI